MSNAQKSPAFVRTPPAIAGLLARWALRSADDHVLDAGFGDGTFLLESDVFTPDVIDNWISYKRTNEVDAIRLRPHPWEFALYFDI